MIENLKRLNVLFVMFQMGMGGSERLVYNLALKLDRSRFYPSVAWFVGNEALSEFKDLQIPLYHVPKTKRVDLSAMQRLHRIIRENEIDVVNAQHFMPAVYSYYGCKIKERRSLIFTAHSKWEIEEIPWKWKMIGRHLLSRIDTSVGVTRETSNCIQETFKTDAQQNVTIENGVDIGAFNPMSNVEGLKRAVLGLSGHEKLVGIVANFKEVKNHRFLLEAFAKLVEKYDNVRLLLVGTGFTGDADNTEEGLRRFVNENLLTGRVIFLGYRSDIPQLLRVMDVFCLPSFKEGLPISLIEAMAAGLPIVGTNVDGIKDLVIPNRNGLLVDLGDVDGLVSALDALITNDGLRERMGNESRNLAINTYSLRRCIDEYEKLFLSLVQHKKPRARKAVAA